MFGLLVGTLNKAKIEDKERNASEPAKKRQLIDQRLQNKLRKETDSVRRAEEAKKDKMTANRKEEELQLKDSIYKYRRIRLPLLSNFLVTSDDISVDNLSSNNPLTFPPRSHPPLYFLPKILTPAQEAFLARRKAEQRRKWTLFRNEREAGIAEINALRQRVADEEERRKSETKLESEQMDTDPAPTQPLTSEDLPTTKTPIDAVGSASDANQDKNVASEQKGRIGRIGKERRADTYAS